MARAPQGESSEAREARLLRAREQMQKWRADNPEKKKAIDKRYRDKLTPEQVEARRENERAWRAANKFRVREKANAWRAANPRTTLMDTQKRRARIAAVNYEPFTIEDMLARWGTDCHLCHEPIDFSAPSRIGQEGWERGLHIDHVIALAQGGAHNLENCKPAHGECNLAKGFS